ncbi:ABC transporter permease [Actinotalea fermentans]|uniref:ABC transporter permease n=1 Tax=Actinotalea fermentans TaxID=43671 RepID=A0A511YT33_9CELL|nr:ABC transporter permease [Actinotalea fermentans]KGM17600.1 ABC transporter permease [Actinotalea fermentans ATCC 43279 = JCM 9966 = DSM 3133]GEN78336.1 ABC transporter permease [Actinotalea fermentans]
MTTLLLPALRSEYRKFVTTRLWWVLLLTMALYMAFIAVVMAFALTNDPASATAGMPGTDGAAAPIPPRDIALAVYTLAPSLGYVFPVIVGAMSVAGEFRHMTITPTLLAEPRRDVVIGAKLLASLPVGLLFGLAGVLATFLPGAAVLAASGESTFLTDSEVVQAGVWSAVALAVWTLVGVGFGTALKNQVVGIVVILAFTQIVEPVLRIAFAMIEPLAGVARWLPGAAGEAIAGSSFYSAAGMNELLPRWQGLVVLVAYGLVLSAIGRMTTFSRDIT